MSRGRLALGVADDVAPINGSLRQVRCPLERRLGPDEEELRLPITFL